MQIVSNVDRASSVAFVVPVSLDAQGKAREQARIARLSGMPSRAYSDLSNFEKENNFSFVF